MIEIIKKGTKTKCTCKQCGCLFTYEEEDLKKKEYVHPLNGLDLPYVICPQCSNKITVGGASK